MSLREASPWQLWLRKANRARLTAKRLGRWLVDDAFRAPERVAPDGAPAHVVRVPIARSGAHPQLEAGKRHNVKLAATAFHGVVVTPDRQLDRAQCCCSTCRCCARCIATSIALRAPGPSAASSAGSARRPGRSHARKPSACSPITSSSAAPTPRRCAAPTASPTPSSSACPPCSTPRARPSQPTRRLRLAGLAAARHGIDTALAVAHQLGVELVVRLADGSEPADLARRPGVIVDPRAPVDAIICPAICETHLAELHTTGLPVIASPMASLDGTGPDPYDADAFADAVRASLR